MKSKRSKATDISNKVKKIVYERDNGICVICKQRAGNPNMHFIRRSQGGLGIPENVVCGCMICHDEFDFDRNGKRRLHEEKIRQYLKNEYENWKEEELVYKKFGRNYL